MTLTAEELRQIPNTARIGIEYQCDLCDGRGYDEPMLQSAGDLWRELHRCSRCYGKRRICKDVTLSELTILLRRFTNDEAM